MTAELSHCAAVVATNTLRLDLPRLKGGAGRSPHANSHRDCRNMRNPFTPTRLSRTVAFRSDV